MKDFPRGGIIGKTVHAVKKLQQLRIPLHAANAGFFMVLSVFPALLLVLSLLRYTGLSVDALMEFLQSFLPSALADAAEELVFSTYQIDEHTQGIIGVVAPTRMDYADVCSKLAAFAQAMGRMLNGNK